ncbi:hypothetical protein P3J6_121418 [Pseudoalteromonas sp. 3J6]|nr:hypothetical protein P3J6_121418 [Pseudoalteromonas sp. 3J6]
MHYYYCNAYSDHLIHSYIHLLSLITDSFYISWNFLVLYNHHVGQKLKASLTIQPTIVEYHC